MCITRKNILIAFLFFIVVVFVPMMINSSGAAAGSAIIHIGWVHDLLESAIGFKKVFLMRYSYWEPCALIERSLIAVLCIVIYLFYSHLKNKSSW